MLAQFSTRIYSTDSARQNNLEITSNKLNGTIVKPNETFSFTKTIGPSTSAKGYEEADIYDSNGNKTIVEHFTSNDIFGEIFYTIATNNELFVKARHNSEVLFFSYDLMKHKCKTNCAFHKIFQDNLSELILSKVTMLNTRVELLTKRSIRDKLLGYFSILSVRNFNRTFSLPFSLTDLADYLSIDRSAMMRELKYLKDDGIIKKNGNKITLLIQ